MKSYLINIKNNTSASVGIYSTNATTWRDVNQPHDWWRIGGLSSVELNLKANDFIYRPKISFTMGFLDEVKYDGEMNFDGINIFCSGSGSVHSKAFVSSNAFVNYNGKPICAIQELDFKVDAENNSVELKLIMPLFTEEQSPGFCKKEIEKELKDIPSWVTIGWRSMEPKRVTEIGLDEYINVIDSNVE